MVYQVQYLLASGFYSGHLPVSGTAGSVVAYLIWYVGLAHLPLAIQMLVIIGSFFIGIWVSEAVIKEVNDTDPSVIVWDEFVGAWIACWMLPRAWLYLLISFIAFRLFDILKPFPASWADRKLSGGLGVMLDDVFAGLYAFGTVWLLIKIATSF